MTSDDDAFCPWLDESDPDDVQVMTRRQARRAAANAAVLLATRLAMAMILPFPRRKLFIDWSTGKAELPEQHDAVVLPFKPKETP
jgi:hypothetical protein